MTEGLNGLLKFFRDEQEVIVPVDKPSFVLGRDLAADIRVIQDPKVSRRHCRVFIEDGSFYVEDLGSSNGTYVNDAKIKGAHRLEVNDKIRMGGKQFIFITDQRVGAATVIIKSPLHFCAVCSGSVREYEILQGLARQAGEKYICGECSEEDTVSNKVFKDYIIEKKIAQGGMGVVYKAHHRILEKVVALKMIREGRDTDADTIRRFMREVRLGSLVKHPNIVEFFDAGEHDGVKYLIMEYCEGPTLAEQLAGRKTINIAHFGYLATQLLDAIQAVHDAELVHRDIKPGNVLVMADNTAKLIDFGLVKSLDPTSQSIITQSGIVMGTPNYMPPEQIQDSRVPDIRGDVYSLGATFYRMLCGRPPVKGKTVVEFIRNLTSQRVPPPVEENNEVDPALSDVIMESLVLNPDERFQTADAFREALEEVI